MIGLDDAFGPGASKAIDKVLSLVDAEIISGAEARRVLRDQLGMRLDPSDAPIRPMPFDPPRPSFEEETE